MRKAWYIYLVISMVIGAISVGSDGWFHKGDPVAAFIFFAVAGWLWWMYKAPQRQMENARKLEEEQIQFERQQEALRQEEALRKQQELERTLSEKRIACSEELGKKILRHHVDLILSAVTQLPGSEEDNKAMWKVINESINNVLMDSKIVPTHFSERSIENDKEIIFTHLEECRMTNHPVAKRLRACLDSAVAEY